VADLHDARGAVTLPGFYDDVLPTPAAVADSIAALPFDDEHFRTTANGAALHGESGASTLERIWVRPTAEVTGIGAGYLGEGIKTIVPAHATVKFTFRLVPDQMPDSIAVAFREWIAVRIPEGVECVVTPMGAVAPALTPIDHPAVAAASRAIERVWGVAPVFTREGGSGPEEALGRVLDGPVVFVGVGLPDDSIHAPNERIVLDQFWKGVLAIGELWFELAGVGMPIPHPVSTQGEQ
jgi:acetylornithine deacetylase/succinyl-diaminopimelate desuccinylase-like protein